MPLPAKIHPFCAPHGSARGSRLSQGNAWQKCDFAALYYTSLSLRKGFNYNNLAPLFKQKTAEPFYVTMPYNEAEQNVAIKLSTHQGQELDIIVKGRMRVQVGSHIEELGAGDTIYYNSGTPHGMIAIGGEPCVFLAVVLKPQVDSII